MSKLKKSLLIILALAVIILSFSVVIQFQDVVSLPVHFISVDDYPLLGEYLPLVLFSLSVFAIAGSILAILWIIVSPGKKSKLTFKGQNGELGIEKKSIENFILYSLQEEHFIDEPKVKVKLTKKKVSVLIRGNLREQYHIPDEYQQYTEKLEKQLEAILGTESKRNVHVLVRIENHQKKKQTSRVY